MSLYLYINLNKPKPVVRPWSKELRRKVEKRLPTLFWIFLPLFWILIPLWELKIYNMGRGVLRDEFLHMWELSTFHSLQLSISSYGLKTTSRRPKLHFWHFWTKRLFFFRLLRLLFSFFHFIKRAQAGPPRGPPVHCTFTMCWYTKIYTFDLIR